MDEVPTLQELKTAVESLKCGKSPGPDRIPAEVFKHGGEDLLNRLADFFPEMLESLQSPPTMATCNDSYHI